MPKKLATTLMLLAAAVAGGIIALGLDRALHRPAVAGVPATSPSGRRAPAMGERRPNPHQRADRGDPHDWLARQLQLSPAQRAQIDSLMTRQQEEFRAIREETRPRFDSITARTHRALDSVLSPEQRHMMDSITRRRPSS